MTGKTTELDGLLRRPGRAGQSWVERLTPATYARLLGAARHPDRALEVLESEILSCRDRPSGWMPPLGTGSIAAWLERGLLDRAEEYVETCLSLATAMASRAWIAVATSHVGRGAIQEARHALGRAEAVLGEQEPLPDGLAALWVRLGDESEAIALLARQDVRAARVSDQRPAESIRGAKEIARVEIAEELTYQEALEGARGRGHDLLAEVWWGPRARALARIARRLHGDGRSEVAESLLVSAEAALVSDPEHPAVDHYYY